MYDHEGQYWDARKGCWTTEKPDWHTPGIGYKPYTPPPPAPEPPKIFDGLDGANGKWKKTWWFLVSFYYSSEFYRDTRSFYGAGPMDNTERHYYEAGGED